MLEVRDHGDLLRFTFDDLVKYAGRSSIGGVAHGYKVMERALPGSETGDGRRAPEPAGN
jgi:hypothetical protein